MPTTRTSVYLECDNCEERLSDAYHQDFADEDDALTAARHHGWQIRGDDHFCPACRMESVYD